MVIGWRACCYLDNDDGDGDDGGDYDDGVGSGSGDGCIIALVWVDSNDILSVYDDGGHSDRHTPANCIVGLGGHRSVMLMMITMR